jgi:hypothetical protein
MALQIFKTHFVVFQQDKNWKTGFALDCGGMNIEGVSITAVLRTAAVSGCSA